MISTKETAQIIHLSRGQHAMGTRELLKSYSNRLALALIKRGKTARHRSGLLLGVGTGEW